MFKNKQWSEIGELRTAARHLNAVYTNGKFLSAVISIGKLKALVVWRNNNIKQHRSL